MSEFVFMGVYECVYLLIHPQYLTTLCTLTATLYSIHIHTCIHAYTHTCIYTHTHSYTYTHTVTVVKLVTEGTVDSDIYDMGVRKRELSKAVLSNDFDADKTGADMGDDEGEGGGKGGKGGKGKGKKDKDASVGAIGMILQKALQRKRA